MAALTLARLLQSRRSLQAPNAGSSQRLSTEVTHSNGSGSSGIPAHNAAMSDVEMGQAVGLLVLCTCSGAQRSLSSGSAQPRCTDTPSCLQAHVHGHSCCKCASLLTLDTGAD